MRKLFPSVPRSAINKALRKGDVRIGGRRVKADHRVEEGDIIEVRAPFAAEARRPAERISGGAAARAAGELEILFRNEDLLAVNKPSGLSVHGADSLTGRVRALLAEEARRATAGRSPAGRHASAAPPRAATEAATRTPRAHSLSFRPGPLHRLDRLTTGVIVYGVSLEGSKRFSAALARRRITKYYLALLRGRVPEAAHWEDTLETEGKSQHAELSVFPVLYFQGATLAVCVPHTGRTHQIRRQAAIHGYPLLNDHAYQGGSPSQTRSLSAGPTGQTTPPRLSGGYLLHALSLSAPEELALGFNSILAPLPEESANRLASYVVSGSTVEPARTPKAVARRLERPVERLTEEPGSASFLLTSIAAEIHERRDAFYPLHGSS
jgi:23S rRNA pseudouridine955/2504/2580 synthase